MTKPRVVKGVGLQPAGVAHHRGTALGLALGQRLHETPAGEPQLQQQPLLSQGRGDALHDAHLRREVGQQPLRDAHLRGTELREGPLQLPHRCDGGTQCGQIGLLGGGMEVTLGLVAGMHGGHGLCGARDQRGVHPHPRRAGLLDERLQLAPASHRVLQQRRPQLRRDALLGVQRLGERGRQPHLGRLHGQETCDSQRLLNGLQRARRHRSTQAFPCLQRQANHTALQPRPTHGLQPAGYHALGAHQRRVQRLHLGTAHENVRGPDLACRRPRDRVGEAAQQRAHAVGCGWLRRRRRNDAAERAGGACRHHRRVQHVVRRHKVRVGDVNRVPDPGKRRNLAGAHGAKLGQHEFRLVLARHEAPCGAHAAHDEGRAALQPRHDVLQLRAVDGHELAGFVAGLHGSPAAAPAATCVVGVATAAQVQVCKLLGVELAAPGEHRGGVVCCGSLEHAHDAVRGVGHRPHGVEHRELALGGGSGVRPLSATAACLRVQARVRGVLRLELGQHLGIGGACGAVFIEHHEEAVGSFVKKVDHHPVVRDSNRVKLDLAAWQRDSVSACYW